MKKSLVILTALLLLFTCAQAEDEEISISDTAGIVVEEVSYDEVNTIVTAVCDGRAKGMFREWIKE